MGLVGEQFYEVATGAPASNPWMNKMSDGSPIPPKTA
jgi:hypothetical protein